MQKIKDVAAKMGVGSGATEEERAAERGAYGAGTTGTAGMGTGAYGTTGTAAGTEYTGGVAGGPAYGGRVSTDSQAWSMHQPARLACSVRPDSFVLQPAASCRTGGKEGYRLRSRCPLSSLPSHTHHFKLPWPSPLPFP